MLQISILELLGFVCVGITQFYLFSLSCLVSNQDSHFDFGNFEENTNFKLVNGEEYNFIWYIDYAPERK